MKEELITFETAVLAKENGFDWPCYYYIWNDSTSKKPMSVIGSSNKGKPCNQEEWTDYANNKKVFTISIPTQSLLQRWLREEHGVEFILMCGGDGEEKWYKVTLPSCYTPNKLGGNTQTSNTYESALEKGLQEALKLIQ